RLATLQMDEATAQALATQQPTTRAPKTPEISQEWRTNPETFLLRALQSFQTNYSLPSPPA
ncbi:MAG: hypothetical protein U0176_20775, partial [Bacteroidia bacterium]